MSTNTRTWINSELTSRARSRRGNIHRHKLPTCERTGLARYRDRHQARQGAIVTTAGLRGVEVDTFACPDCRGFHLEKLYRREPIVGNTTLDLTDKFTSSPAEQKRRYVLFDVENPTRGAKASCEELAAFWCSLKQNILGITPDDHVVVGAARYVVRKYRAAIQGANVKWVVGADAPDGADRALLAAIDLHRVARDFDELVIISGDHTFAELARRAKATGLSVCVITAEHPDQRSMLSRELASVANTRTLVPLKPRTSKHKNLTPISPAADRKHFDTAAA